MQFLDLCSAPRTPFKVSYISFPIDALHRAMRSGLPYLTVLMLPKTAFANKLVNLHHPLNLRKSKYHIPQLSTSDLMFPIPLAHTKPAH